MIRPFGPEMEQARELEVRAALVRAQRIRPESAEPSRSSGRTALALATALRRVANRLDSSGAPGPQPAAVSGATGPC
jgi:hypothetical protein